MRTSSTLLITLVLAGCGGVDHSNVMTLSQLREPHLLVEVQERSAIVRLHASECPTFNGTATLNGRTLEQYERGGAYSSFGLGKGLVPGVSSGCADVEWTLPSPLPDEPLAELEVFDATGRLTLGVRNLGAPRGLAAPLPPTPWELHWGEPAELSWTPSTDRLSPLVSITLEGDAAPEVLDEVSTQDGVIRFWLPPAPTDAGTAPSRSGQIRFDIRTVRPDITHCEPEPRGCSVTVYFSPGTEFKLPITVQ